MTHRGRPIEAGEDEAGEDKARTATLGRRYDDIAEAYLRWWAPVIRPHAEGVLDLVADAVEAGATRVLDVGTGSGTVAIAALRRWPHLEVTAADPSGEMLAVTEREARALRLGGRLRLVRAAADRMPLEAGAFDIVLSSFVYQLVPDRHRALVEARRVLRDGGRLAWRTWLRGQQRFRGDDIADEVLAEAGFEDPSCDGRSGDPASVPAAAAATRRAGFRDVRAAAGELSHAWQPETFLGFFTRFDEASLFAEMAPAEARRIETAMLERLRRLTPEELTLRLPTVSVVGRAR